MERNTIKNEVFGEKLETKESNKMFETYPEESEMDEYIIRKDHYFNPKEHEITEEKESFYDKTNDNFNEKTKENFNGKNKEKLSVKINEKSIEKFNENSIEKNREKFNEKTKEKEANDRDLDILRRLGREDEKSLIKLKKVDVSPKEKKKVEKDMEEFDDSFDMDQ